MKSKQTGPTDGLVVSGLTELALGALTGWPKGFTGLAAVAWKRWLSVR
jgi:hypothetical protein